MWKALKEAVPQTGPNYFPHLLTASQVPDTAPYFHTKTTSGTTTTY